MLSFVGRGLLLIGMLCHAATTFASKPNVILILADDLGYSDVGFNGCKEIPTPHLDALAADGVVFEAGYATHPYCSPSRAGLLTGRYQQRFGHECNPGASEDDPDSGLPLTETLLPSVLQKGGYKTACIGKWHLGDQPQFWPNQRGFDQWFGFSGGGRSYWAHQQAKNQEGTLRRNGEPVEPHPSGYITDVFSDEACKFIEANSQSPFFIYLAYNAPHTPNHAPQKYLNAVSHIEYGERAVYGAMVHGMDVGIGRVIDTLKKQNLYDNTLIVFYSDNGGKGASTNFPLRGHKGMTFEGGIRVPFCCTWPAALPKSQRFGHPISALDLFPTILAATGVKHESPQTLDGVDLLPHLTGTNSERPHQTLFWRFAASKSDFEFAVRDGDFKLVDSYYKKRKLLFDLDNDPGEMHDLSESRPDVVARLSGLIETWNATNIVPKWLDPHGENCDKEEAAVQQALDVARSGERKAKTK